MHIDIQNIKKQFSDKTVLDGISLQADAGDIIGIIGPNGSGKTTFVRCITDFYYDYTGDISYFGKNFRDKKNVSNIKKQISFIADNDNIDLNLTGFEYVNLYCNLFVDKFDEKYIKNINDLFIAFGIEGDKNRFLSEYSHGMLKKLCIIAGLSYFPKIIILDEPFNGLDPEYSILLIDIIKRLSKDGITFIITSHNLEIIDDIAVKLLILINGCQRYFGDKNKLLNTFKNTNLKNNWLDIIGKNKEFDKNANIISENFKN